MKFIFVTILFLYLAIADPDDYHHCSSCTAHDYYWCRDYGTCQYSKGSCQNGGSGQEYCCKNCVGDGRYYCWNSASPVVGQCYSYKPSGMFACIDSSTSNLCSCQSHTTYDTCHSDGNCEFCSDDGVQVPCKIKNFYASTGASCDSVEN